MKPFWILTFVVLAAFALVSCARNRANDRRVTSPSPAFAPQSGPAAKVSGGRALFLKNCAHCHGAGPHGHEGPDLHNLDWTDEQITTRIRNGTSSELTALAGKLTAPEIAELVVYLCALK